MADTSRKLRLNKEVLKRLTANQSDQIWGASAGDTNCWDQDFCGHSNQCSGFKCPSLGCTNFGTCPSNITCDGCSGDVTCNTCTCPSFDTCTCYQTCGDTCDCTNTVCAGDTCTCP